MASSGALSSNHCPISHIAANIMRLEITTPIRKVRTGFASSDSMMDMAKVWRIVDTVLMDDDCAIAIII